MKIGYTKNGKKTHLLLNQTFTAHCSSAVDIATRTDLTKFNLPTVNCTRCQKILNTQFAAMLPLLP